MRRQLCEKFLLLSLSLCSSTLAACGNASTPHPPSPLDLNNAEAAGNVRALCSAVAGSHHCLGYVLTEQGLRHYQATRREQSSSVRDYGDLLLRRVCLSDDNDNANCANNAVSTQTWQPNGYGPKDLQAAYGITNSSQANGRLVALVESGDTPTLEADLNVYRTQYGLSPCTSSNGCLRKVGQDGSSVLPPPDPNWEGETQLDAEMVSALCPNCRILVVEASNSGIGLDQGVNAAVRLGAFTVSNSWGGNENASEAAFFNHPGVPITVASGDKGYGGGPQSPADLSTVIAVGGTTLLRTANARGWNESAWSGSGSGCSKLIAKPAWQTDNGCPMRAIADVSFVADPTSGVAVYFTQDGDSGDASSGWRVAGGTSVGAPAIAAIYALSGSSVSDASSLYAKSSQLNDVSGGMNGTCSPLYLCKATPGYDAPTGNGTPNGLGAF